MKQSLLWAAALSAAACGPLVAFAQPDPIAPAGDQVIRRSADGGEIVIRTTSRLAGAIDSLTWNGREFVDSADHGRQLQSAINLDCGAGRMLPETFNPTEAGSRRDGAGRRSTSRLLHVLAADGRLQSTTQMAFWLAPGEASAGHPARNKAPLSNHLLTKRVQIGFRDMPRVLQYDVTFGLPVDEQHQLAQFEVLTGYMPPQFASFYKFNPRSQQLQPLSDGPGEQPWPVVLSTADGRHAMGCYTPDRFGSGWSGPGYGRFRFAREAVVKWNCVFRYRDASGVRPGDYPFRLFVIVGDQAMVRSDLIRLHALRENQPSRGRSPQQR